jgi:hypothetical protein
MDELELVRRHLVDEPDDLGALRVQVAARTWDRVTVDRIAPAAPVPADRTDLVHVYAEPLSSEPAARRRGLSRLAVAASIVLLLGVVLVGARCSPRHDTPAAGPTAEALEEALPRLLNDDMTLRWPAIAWDASQADKDAFEAAYRPKMERLLAETYSTTSMDEHRRYTEFSLLRALRTPQPIVDHTEIIDIDVDDISVDDVHGEAIVTYRERVHVQRDPHAPGQLGSFVTDADGWWELNDKSRVILTWEGSWRLDAIYDLLAHG